MGTARSKRATIGDVARAAGVSVSTVSRVINNKQDVSEQTREAVLSAMEATGFVSSPIARSLVGARTRVLGIYIRYIAQEFSMDLLSGIVDASEQAGYGTVFFAGEGALRSPGAALISTMPDGLLVVSPGFEAAPPSPWPSTERPVVFVEPPDEDSEGVVVTITNREGERELTRYVLELGHRLIGYVAGPPSIPSSRERLEGFRAALAEHGLEPDPGLIAEGGFKQVGGYEAGRRLLSLIPRPTAIIASNDYEAFGVLQAARELGLEVPADLSVAGFDDVRSAQLVHPSLTTVHQPLYEMGQKAVELLVSWIESGEGPAPQRFTLPTRLVIRESCAPIR